MRTRRLLVGKDSNEEWMYLRPDHLERHLEAYKDRKDTDASGDKDADAEKNTPGVAGSERNTPGVSGSERNTPGVSGSDDGLDARLMAELPTRLVDSVKDFVSHSSGIDGAEIPKQSKETDPKKKVCLGCVCLCYFLFKISI